jgi:hypothetical protein
MVLIYIICRHARFKTTAIFFGALSRSRHIRGTRLWFAICFLQAHVSCRPDPAWAAATRLASLHQWHPPPGQHGPPRAARA